ncbi:hypothetical protein OIV83_001405 [Microbotryomycetes sp. JL201]|nr:hypothetical protein OIV83_001405 [Microbotryomycetes sp. JL201]
MDERMSDGESASSQQVGAGDRQARESSSSAGPSVAAPGADGAPVAEAGATLASDKVDKQGDATMAAATAHVDTPDAVNGDSVAQTAPSITSEAAVAADDATAAVPVGEQHTSHGDALADQEYDAFGVEAEDYPLPPPPKGASVVQAAGADAALGAPGPRTTSRQAAITAPLARNKRPKNVKFSPSKGKQAGRRSMTSGGAGDAPSIGLPNHDYCDACGGKGHFLCCDGGCLRSFHFQCLEPPLEIDEVPDEAWYCKACRAATDPPPKPPRGWFRDLLYKVEIENPKAFSLPPEVRSLFKNIVAGPSGELIDTTEHRPPSKVTGRAVGQEDRDGYRLKDKTGKPILCYSCSESASIPKQRRIISCDFCDQHWHLDCLDPPMIGMPPPTRKWMCPVHSDHVLPKKRIPKATTVVPVHEPRQRNNGDIMVVSRPNRILDDERYEEMLVNRIRFQVPEDVIVLDFWKKAHKLTTNDKAWDASWRQWGLEPVPRHLRHITTKELDELIDVANTFYKDLTASAASTNHPLNAAGKRTDSERRESDSEITMGAADENSTETPPPPKRQRLSLAGPSASSGVSQIPPYKGRTGSSTSIHDTTKRSVASPGTTRRSAASPSATLPAEVAVKSKDDLKALMHVRKLLAALEGKGPAGDAAVDFDTKAALLGFIEGAPVVPKLDFMRPEALRAPWELPWEDTSKSNSASPVAAADAESTTKDAPATAA